MQIFLLLLVKKSQAPATLLYFVACVPNGRRNADFQLELGENKEVIFPPAKFTDAWTPSTVPLGVWIPMKSSKSNECWGRGDRKDRRNRNRSKKGIIKMWKCFMRAALNIKTKRVWGEETIVPTKPSATWGQGRCPVLPRDGTEGHRVIIRTIGNQCNSSSSTEWNNVASPPHTWEHFNDVIKKMEIC